MITHIRGDQTTIGVEGPLAWTGPAQQETYGQTFHKGFALGHQFHALLLHFSELVDNPEPAQNIAFQGGRYNGIRGDYPYGGAIYLISGDSESRPLGIQIVNQGPQPIDVIFQDWRKHGDSQLPFTVVIDDGDRLFTYSFTDIRIENIGLIDFYKTTSLPDLDGLNIYRLHRKLLAAHCLGDADLMAELTAPESVVASRGELLHTTPEKMRERFGSAFQKWNYTEYIDLQDPEIEWSENGQIGWIAVNVRAVGKSLETDEVFDDQWAWIMLVKKIDGKWLGAGNASNIAE
jgi:hypothetical protein